MTSEDPTMRRRLMLLRHAKSAWPEGVEDHERPLAKRGEAAAPKMGAYLRDQGLHPDLVLISTAVRTRETWALLAPEIGSDIPHAFEAGIYEASREQILDILRNTPDDVKTLLVVGHNPGFEDLALWLAKAEPSPDLERMREKFPTAALAVIDFKELSWPRIGGGMGKLERFVTPRSLAQGSEN